MDPDDLDTYRDIIEGVLATMCGPIHGGFDDTDAEVVDIHIDNWEVFDITATVLLARETSVIHRRSLERHGVDDVEFYGFVRTEDIEAPDHLKIGFTVDETHIGLRFLVKSFHTSMTKQDAQTQRGGGASR